METNLPRIISDLTFGYDIRSLDDIEKRPWLSIQYSAQFQNANGDFSKVGQLSDAFSIDWEGLSIEVRQKIETLERVISAHIPTYEIPVTGGVPLEVQAIISEIFCNYFTMPPTNIPNQLSAMYFFKTQPKLTTQLNLEWNSLSRSQQLVVSNIASWVKQQAWEHLTNNVREISGQPPMVSRVYKVFISYKQKTKSEQIAETIAERLSQQGIRVWFDKWEIKAGDSIPGKIGEGFEHSDACLIFLSQGFSVSKWCTKEMNVALTKAINERLTVIPSLIETCTIPELLKDLKRVDFIEPTAIEFEQKLTEITDAIYKVDLNPYR